MKFLGFLSIVTFTAAANTLFCKFQVEAPGTEIDNYGFGDSLLGSSWNWINITSEDRSFRYDLPNENFQEVEGDHVFTISIQNNVPLISNMGTTKFTFEDGYLQYNDTSDGFYGCKNVNTPYGYVNSYGLFNYQESSDVPDSCVSIKVRATIYSN